MVYLNPSFGSNSEISGSTDTLTFESPIKL